MRSVERATGSQACADCVNLPTVRGPVMTGSAVLRLSLRQLSHTRSAPRLYDPHEHVGDPRTTFDINQPTATRCADIGVMAVSVVVALTDGRSSRPSTCAENAPRRRSRANRCAAVLR